MVFTALKLLSGFISSDNSSPHPLGFSLNLGDSSSRHFRNGGPSYQVFNFSSWVPLIRIMIRSDVFTRFRAHCFYCISATLTKTNSLGEVLRRVNMVWESIQNSFLQLLISANSSASLHVPYNLAIEKHPVNSKHGIDFFFEGATNALTMCNMQE